MEPVLKEKKKDIIRWNLSKLFHIAFFLIKLCDNWGSEEDVSYFEKNLKKIPIVEIKIKEEDIPKILTKWFPNEKNSSTVYRPR